MPFRDPGWSADAAMVALATHGVLGAPKAATSHGAGTGVDGRRAHAVLPLTLAPPSRLSAIEAGFGAAGAGCGLPVGPPEIFGATSGGLTAVGTLTARGAPSRRRRGGIWRELWLCNGSGCGGTLKRDNCPPPSTRSAIVARGTLLVLIGTCDSVAQDCCSDAGGGRSNGAPTHASLPAVPTREDVQSWQARRWPTCSDPWWMCRGHQTENTTYGVWKDAAPCGMWKGGGRNCCWFWQL